jgi:hypothetical protein
LRAAHRDSSVERTLEEVVVELRVAEDREIRERWDWAEEPGVVEDHIFELLEFTLFERGHDGVERVVAQVQVLHFREALEQVRQGVRGGVEVVEAKLELDDC